MTYYRCLAHIPRTLAIVADSYRLVYVVFSLRLLERWNPGRRDRVGRPKRVYTTFAPTADVFFICYARQQWVPPKLQKENIVGKEFWFISLFIKVSHDQITISFRNQQRASFYDIFFSVHGFFENQSFNIPLSFMKLRNAIDHCETSFARRIKIFEDVRSRNWKWDYFIVMFLLLMKSRMLYFVHTYFLARGKNSEGSSGRTSIVSFWSAFSSRSIPPATNGQYEDRLRIVSLGSASFKLAPLGSSSSPWRRQPKRKRRRHSSTAEGTRLLVFARLPNDGQRSP